MHEKDTNIHDTWYEILWFKLLHHDRVKYIYIFLCFLFIFIRLHRNQCPTICSQSAMPQKWNPNDKSVYRISASAIFLLLSNCNMYAHIEVKSKWKHLDVVEIPKRELALQVHSARSTESAYTIPKSPWNHDEALSRKVCLERKYRTGQVWPHINKYFWGGGKLRNWLFFRQGGLNRGLVKTLFSQSGDYPPREFFFLGLQSHVPHLSWTFNRNLSSIRWCSNEHAMWYLSTLA